MIPFGDTPKNIAVCLTHPDDEMFMCALIQRLIQNGHRLWLSWTHSNSIREVEAREFARLLKIPQEQLLFFKAPDGEVCEMMLELVQPYESWFHKVDPQFVIVGAFEQGHLDHDATHWVVTQALLKRARSTQSGSAKLIEIPFYHSYLRRLQKLNCFANPEFAPTQTVVLSRQERKLKKQAARLYPSQNIRKILVSHEWIATKVLRSESMLQREVFREVSLRTIDYRKPAQNPRIGAKVAKSASWNRWIVAVTNAELKLSKPGPVSLKT